jgi:hypothetical protein
MFLAMVTPDRVGQERWRRKVTKGKGEDKGGGHMIQQGRKTGAEGDTM